MGFMAQGGDGCISVTANVAPRLCGDMHDAWKKRDLDKVFELQDRLMPLHKAMFCETSPGPVKYGGELIGQCSAEMRLPMVPIAEASKKAVREAMVHAGLDKLGKGVPLAKKPDLGRTVVAQNRKARHNYFIEETFEAGLVLSGTEVKSLRGGRSSIGESYVTEQGGEAWLVNADIPEYASGNRFNHERKRRPASCCCTRSRSAS